MAFIQRVQGMLMHPRAEWRAIDQEATSAADLYRAYVIPLAIIANLPMAIGSVIFNALPLGSAVAQAVVGFALSLAIVYLIALVVDRLAPLFGGTRSMGQALKVAAYGLTAAYLSGVFSIAPALAVLGILGLYSVYQLYTGLPLLMRTPPERAVTYTVAVLVAVAVLTAALSLLYFAVFPPVA